MAQFLKVSEQQHYVGWRITVGRATFRAQDGTEFERDVVRHPGAVGVLPLHDDDTVTLVCQYRAALETDLVELPAGIRDVVGEDDAVTAARELAEEAGLRAGHLEHLVEFHNSPGFCNESVAVYLATDLHPVNDARQGIEEEAMTVERIPLMEALARIADGRITDAKTIIGLQALALRRR